MPHSVHNNTASDGQAVPSVSSLSIGNPGNAYSGGTSRSSSSSSSSGLDYPYYDGASSSVSIRPSAQKPATAMLNMWLGTLDRKLLTINEVLCASYQVSPVPEDEEVRT